MSDYCLDSCSLLNLYCGWGGIEELRYLGASWSISDTAFGEFRYVRAYREDGSTESTVVEPASVLAQFSLRVLTVSGPDEQATLVELSRSLDDGEAASLTLAKHRDLTFVSDDRPALVAAAALSVPAASTLELLHGWSRLDAANQARLPQVARRIRELASFAPPRSNPYRSWWGEIPTPS